MGFRNHVRNPLSSRVLRLGRISPRATLLALTLLVLVAALAAGCSRGAAVASGAPGASGSAGAGLRVVTTTTVFADIVANVGRGRVTTSSLIPAGVGPEDYEPRPDDVRKLSDADLVVSNGVGLDNFLDRLLASADGNKPRLV